MEDEDEKGSYTVEAALLMGDSDPASYGCDLSWLFYGSFGGRYRQKQWKKL